MKIISKCRHVWAISWSHILLKYFLTCSKCGKQKTKSANVKMRGKARILFFLIGIFVFSGCAIPNSQFKIYYVTTPKVDLPLTCMNNIPFRQEYREWLFVNEKKFLRGLYVEYDGIGRGWYAEESVETEKDYESFFRAGYFPRYKTLGQLEKKWKNKPKPKGFDYFMTHRFISYSDKEDEHDSFSLSKI